MKKEFVNPSVKYRAKIKKLRQEIKYLKRINKAWGKIYESDTKRLNEENWKLKVKKNGLGATLGL